MRAWQACGVCAAMMNGAPVFVISSVGAIVAEAGLNPTTSNGCT